MSSISISWQISLLFAQGELRIVSEVNLVVVDVSVRDRQRQPVPNIARSAFQIFDNGPAESAGSFCTRGCSGNSGSGRRLQRKHAAEEKANCCWP